MGYSQFPKEHNRSSHGARWLCPLKNYTGGPGNYAFLSAVTELTETCTCLEVWQRAGHWSHVQFSGRQSHASFEGYTRINPFQLQQIHFGRGGGGGSSEMGIKLVLITTWCNRFPALVWDQKAIVTFPIPSLQPKLLYCPLKSKNIKAQRKAQHLEGGRTQLLIQRKLCILCPTASLSSSLKRDSYRKELWLTDWPAVEVELLRYNLGFHSHNTISLGKLLSFFCLKNVSKITCTPHLKHHKTYKGYKKAYAIVAYIQWLHKNIFPNVVLETPFY